MTNENKFCVRCGLSKDYWKGRWEKPLCKVGETTYEQHTLKATPRTLPTDATYEAIHKVIEPKLDEIKRRYPSELNIEGLEPALTTDIIEVVAFYLADRLTAIEAGLANLEHWESYDDETAKMDIAISLTAALATIRRIINNDT